jgi:hypothetical protein
MKYAVIGGLGAIAAVVIAFWLLIVMVKLTLKLIGLALIVGLGAVIYFEVKKRIGGGNAR